jgi:putative chitinase
VNHAAFFKTVRARLGPLKQFQVDGISTILDVVKDEPLSWQAYMLATAWHETATTMQPIKERGGEAYFTEHYDVAGRRPKVCIQYGNTCAGDGPRFCGRGYVQLTWKSNYAKAGEALGVDLVADPDLAMDARHAAAIMLTGMKEGWFTGKRLATYLPAQGVATADAYRQARRIINGTDKADLIEDYAQVFERALRYGGVE